MQDKIKPNIRVIQKGNLRYQLDKAGRPIRFQPWLGDAFAFLYDFIMARSVFPKKLNADQEQHTAILTDALKISHKQQVLELGTGSGSASDFLPQDNHYTGTDISAGLLKTAVKRFQRAGFQYPEFYVASGDDLPFDAQSFDLCLSILSLNFIGNIENVFQGLYEVLRPSGHLLCAVPIPERKRGEGLIQGTLLSEVRLQKLCHKTGFYYQRIEAENGALLYFWACKTKN